VQAADLSHQLQGNLLIKRKNEFISCSAILFKDVANIIIPLPVINGSDHTPSFYGHDKKKLLQKVISDPEARKLLRRVGDSLELRPEVKDDLKTFIRSKVYNKNAGVIFGDGRASRWHKMKKKSTVRRSSDNYHTESPFGKDIVADLLRFAGASMPNWPWLGIHEWEVPSSSPQAAAVTSSGYTLRLHG